ncbi:alpha-ketoglutarate-dependent 2,4-dichlorophenoxyacetate dioxygenase [Colletotrichum spaethianum]|uniref:Alpha-ketoglutarate-dependent 2,4-dichlorophenoxyacetate dioxygenase n=1 Tax=Colletotrichum spaethianum TaxID=700344 RepID=A0AA37NVW2_9PEZI|nr:alpha-ketoglutarate-dependent 2,4-dichlorophenoxyacetate dioxygenase [Colletotrichum spaethianum]GKT40685.1 alpha-ketoglutarate-dependent 2,4-dichlorophenoxyacetate dioxygenase [Colletotrichum spaethianum]
MGSLAENIGKSLSKLQVVELHPYFGAEISGVDVSKPIPNDVFEDILALSAKYGVLVFRATDLDDSSHIKLARRFGPILNMSQVLAGQKTRLGTYELADLSNVDIETGEPVAVKGPNDRIASFLHADLAYSQQRASWSLLRAYEIPPLGYGGDTIFADTRKAFEDLNEIELGLKEKLLSKNYVGAHSWQHSQKTSNPDIFKDLDPSAYPMAKHPLVELHKPSNRMNLYIGVYLHHIEGATDQEDEIVGLQHTLLQHATKSKYQLNVEWRNPGDLVIWDNRHVKTVEGGVLDNNYVTDFFGRTVMHKAGPRIHAGKFKRDLRRATVLEV